MTLHSSKMEALLSWVNSLKVDDPIERYSQLQDLSVLIKMVTKINGNEEEAIQILQQPLDDRLKFLCTFIQKYCRYGSSVENFVQWQKILQGENAEAELSKVIVLLLYYSTMNSKNPKESEDLDYKTQSELASILRFVLDNEDELCLNENLFNFLQKKALFPSSSDTCSSSEDMSPIVHHKRKAEVRFLELHRVASSSMKGFVADSPSSPMIEVLHTPQFQMRRLKKQLNEERECRDELEVELSENRKHLAEKEAQLFLMQQRIERLMVLSEKRVDQQEPRELEELREKNESLMMRLRDALKQCQDLKTDKNQMDRKIDQLSEENGDLSYKVRDLINRLLQSQGALNEVSEDHEQSLKDWQQKQSQMETELHTAVAEKKCLEERRLILQGKISMLEDQLKKMGESNSQEKGESMGDILKLESLKQEVDELTTQLIGLQAQITQLEQGKSFAKAELEAERARFESEKLQLQEIITNLQTSFSEITVQKEKQDQEARAQEEQLSCQITTLQLEISRLKTSLTQKEEELVSVHQQVEDERKQKAQLVEDLNREEESSRQNIQGLKHEVDNLGSVLKLTEVKLAECTQKLDTESKQIVELRQEREKVSVERDSTLALFQEYKSVKEEELSLLNQTVHNLEAGHQVNLAASEELKREKAELALKVQELDATILDLITKCQNLDTENDAQSKGHASTVECLRAQLLEQENQVRICQQKVSGKKLLTEENIRLKEQLLSMENTMKNLRELLENEKSKYSATIEGEGKRISQLEGEIRKLTESKDQAMLELGEERANGKGLESQLKRLEEEYRIGNENLQRKMSDTSAAITEQEGERERLTKEVGIWQAKYKEAQQCRAQNCSQMEEQIEKLKKDHADVWQELQTEKAKVSELEAQAKDTMSAQLQRVSQLESDLSAAAALVKQKEDEAQKLLTAIQSAQEKIKFAQQEETERFSQLETTLSDVTQDLERLSKELSEEKLKKAELEATVKQLEEQKSERILALESEISSTLAVVKDREVEADKLSRDVELLRSQLEESRLKHQEELTQRSNEIGQLVEEKERAKADLTAERATKVEVEVQLQKSVDTHKREFSALQNELSRSLDLITMKETELERLTKEAALRQKELKLQQQSVTKLAEEVATLRELKERVAMQETELKRYTETAQTGEADISGLKSTIGEKEKEIKHLKQDIQRREKESCSIQEQHQATLLEMKALRSKIAELEKSCSKQNEVITCARKEADDAKAVASERASASERQQEGLQQEKQKTRELELLLEASVSAQAERESAVDALKKELIHKVQELEQSQKAFGETSGELSSVLSAAGERERCLAEAKEQVAKYQKDIENKTEEMVSLHEETSSVTSKLAAKEEACVELKSLLARESIKHGELEDQLKILQSEVEVASKELHEKKGAIESLRTEALSFREDADKQRVSVEELRKELSSQKELTDGLQQDIKSWQGRCDQKEGQMSSLQQQLSSSQSLLEELASLKSSYQEVQADRALVEEKHKEELGKQQRIVEHWQAELERNKAEIAELLSLKEKLSQQELALQSLQTEKSGYLIQISQFQQMNSQLAGENQSLSQVSNQGVKKLEAELSKITEKHSEELESLRLQYEKVVFEGKEQVQDLSQKLEGVTSKYDHAKSKVLDETQKFLEEKQKLLLQVEHLEAAKKDHSEQVEDLSKQLSQQEKATRSQQQKLKRESDAHEEVAEKQKKVTELLSQLEQKEQAVEHYKSQIEKARLHYEAKKQQNQELSEEVQSRTQEQEQLRRENAELKLEHERLSKELQHSLLRAKESEQSSKSLTNQVRSLEAQVVYADRQLREQGKFQVATDDMKSRDTRAAPRATRSHANVSIDSLDESDDEEHPLNSTRKNGRSHQRPTTSAVHEASLESLASNRLPAKVESLESLYFTPIPNRVQSKLDSSLGSIGDLSIDSSKKTQSARRRTTQVINITLTKKTKTEREQESANTSFYSLRSAPSTQSLHQQNPRRRGGPKAAISAPALAICPSDDSLGKLDKCSSEDSLNNSVLMSLPGYRPTTRSSARLSQAGGRNSFYMGTCQDEPDPQEDWSRIAEMQLRNRACPPHLKTCYPLESRPTLCATTITDEEVKMGDPQETMRRATMLPSQIMESTTSTRRMTLAPSGPESSLGGSSSITTRRQMKRVSEEGHHGPDTPESKKSASCFPRPMTPKDKHDGRKLLVAERRKSSSQQQTQASKGQTMSFSILNTPKKLGSSLLRRGLGKKAASPKNSPRARGGSKSNRSSTPTRSPHLSVRKSPSRRSPRGSATKSVKTSHKFFERKQSKKK
ncbi:nuclear mitotic apparatus protein 1 isoform X3 [Ascaphus truei]|uniref:nuclear mitotic apparatus protein 1 isoform X3 n=1 Tax=Ascaphus truei TaxID=8439 RepID=UPI003F5A637D